MPGRLFTNDELKELAVPYPERIKKRIREKRIDEAIALCKEMKGSRVVLHDLLADTSMILWSWIGEHLGDDTLDKRV